MRQASFIVSDINRLLLNDETGDIRAPNVLLTYDYDVKISGK